MALVDMETIAEGLFWAHVYWMNGPTPTGSAHRSEVANPPHLGWGHAYVVDTGGKMVTLFCPFNLEAHQVSRQSSEYHSLSAPKGAYRSAHMAHFLREQWERAARQGWQKDYASCAVVMKMLGVEVPMGVTPEGAEAKSTGGKEADALGLLKPVKRSGRRGQVLAFFLAGEAGARSVHEATAEMGITRSNLLSQCYLLQKDHGIGYEVAGDVVRVSLPDGCTDPFEKEEDVDPLDC